MRNRLLGGKSKGSETAGNQCSVLIHSARDAEDSVNAATQVLTDAILKADE